MRTRSAGRQADLFTNGEPLGHRFPAGPEALPQEIPLERRQLLAWQQRLAAFQHPLWSAAPEGELEQGSLFAAHAESPQTGQPLDPHTLARALHPLALPAEALSFWRWPQAPHAGPALYLVLDRPEQLAHPLLLYVGETARADRRWKGTHDCKSYLAAYREALAKADLASGLSIRFWCDAPAATAARRALEQALIQRWKPPFNKETRSRWSTPFQAESG